MILISHRGNINGVKRENENHPVYINAAIESGYDVEIDVWYLNEKYYLGHDEPQYEIPYHWMSNHGSKLWIHCKNTECVIKLENSDLNYFWHENDTVTLTSKRYVWAYPGKQPIKNSIAVMPELNDDDVSQCLGICSDVISNYK